MEWVLYALLGTQIVLILLAGRGVYYLGEIMHETNSHRGYLDRVLSMGERQTEALVKKLDRVLSMGERQTKALVKELRKIGDRLAAIQAAILDPR